MQDQKTEELIRKAKMRDPDAFTELMQENMKNMYRTALAILMNDEDAADAVQDTILTCWEKLKTLKQPEYFNTWMTRILINKCKDIRRKCGKLVQLEEYEEPAAADVYNVELKEALASLDEKYRVIMVLFYGEGYRIPEIADILKMPQSTVQTRLQRGRRKLKEYYAEEKGAG